LKTHQQSIRKTLKTAYEKANLDPGGAAAHNLRHCFGTSLAENGCSAATIQVLMGHSDIRTSSRYLHPSFQAASDEFKNKSSTYSSTQLRNGHENRQVFEVVSSGG